MEAARTSETSVDNHFTRQYNPEDSSEHHAVLPFISCYEAEEDKAPGAHSLGLGMKPA
jgi:hypothetical protein